MQGLHLFQFFYIFGNPCLQCQKPRGLPLQINSPKQVPTSQELPMLSLQLLPLNDDKPQQHKQIKEKYKQNLQNSQSQWTMPKRSYKRQKKEAVLNEDIQKIYREQQINNLEYSQNFQASYQIQRMKGKRKYKLKTPQEKLLRQMKIRQNIIHQQFNQFKRQYKLYKFVALNQRKPPKNVGCYILRNFFSALIYKKKQENLLKRIFNKLNIPLTQIPDFYDWIFAFKLNYKIDLGRKIVLWMLQQEGREDFKKVLRIVYFNYMRQDSVNRILVSKRCNKVTSLFGRRMMFIQMDDFVKTS